MELRGRFDLIEKCKNECERRLSSLEDQYEDLDEVKDKNEVDDDEEDEVDDEDEDEDKDKD